MLAQAEGRPDNSTRPPRTATTRRGTQATHTPSPRQGSRRDSTPTNHQQDTPQSPQTQRQTRQRNRRPRSSRRPTDLETHFGDPLQEKGDDIIRLSWSNIGPLGFTYYDEDRIQEIRDYIRTNEIDVAGMAELKYNWSQVPYDKRPQQTLRSKTACTVITSHNTHENFTDMQFGGTATIAVDQAAALTDSSGVDPSGLGRW